ncbi:hypothetical protein GOP47_0012626 [Adiantum capillus-veneris]|uniref:Major facilitator superfamily (MFS) profile domain-containing protein n=1 Tax=Adiantum capillus-veneris TaxID=13818 RepID=A0A9D4ZGN0_ADICA|nr:hypothetical protein GOP47_0012626 [Adiantum capillus-veneris]
MAATPLSPSSASEARLTRHVLLCCLMAATASFIYGYDLVVAGGIGIMDDFLQKFYPGVLKQKKNAKQDVYCRYRNEAFQLFASSLYLGAFFAALVASFVSSRYGRKPSMLIAGLLFMAGTLLSTCALNIQMLLSGRALLGCGLGFSTQVVPIYISEISPPHSRGAMNYISGLYLTCGILSANVVNYFANTVHPWGWRISLGILGAPALAFTLFIFFFFETPTSLIQRGHYIKARDVLAILRGHKEVDGEYQGLLQAITVQEKLDKNAFERLFMTKSKVPQLVIGMAIPFFQQVSGIDAIAFYGVFIFKMAGFTDNVALYFAIITGGASLLGIFIALFCVDRIGRIKLLLGGAVTFFLTMVIVAIIFALGLKGAKTGQYLGHGEGIAQVILACVFVTTFASSLGPLAYVIPSEIYDSEVDASDQVSSVSATDMIEEIETQGEEVLSMEMGQSSLHEVDDTLAPEENGLQIVPWEIMDEFTMNELHEHSCSCCHSSS